MTVVLYVERVKTIYFTCIPAVRTLAAGHKMIAEGWQLFDEASGGCRGRGLATAAQVN